VAPSFPANGSSYDYSAVESGFVWLGGGRVPQPVPTSTVFEMSTLVKTGASFGSQNNLIDMRYTQTLAKTAITGDEYDAWRNVPGGQQLQEIADVHEGSSRPNPSLATSSTRTIYSQPPIKVQLPFAIGNSWTGSSAYRYTDSGKFKISNGTSVTFAEDITWDADGSYTRSAVNFPLFIVGHKLASITNVESNGSAEVTSFEDGKKIAVQTIGVPRRAANGSYVIPWSLVWSLPKGAPLPIHTTIPDWYPGGALPPSPLVRSTVVDTGPAALPSSCKVPRSLATSGEAIVRTESLFDPTGSVATIKETSYYANGIGMVCDVRFTRGAGWFVLPPAVKPAGHDAITVTESLTGKKLQSALARTRSMPDALAYAADALAADATRERMSAMDDLRHKVLLQLADPGLKLFGAESDVEQAQTW